MHSNCIDLIFRGQLTTESVMFHQFLGRENGLLLLRRGDESFHSKTNNHDLFKIDHFLIRVASIDHYLSN